MRSIVIAARANRRSRWNTCTFIPAARPSSASSSPRGEGLNRNQRNNPMQLPMHRASKCRARTRSGQPCQAPAMLNGRCRMHGGTSPGAPKGNTAKIVLRLPQPQQQIAAIPDQRRETPSFFNSLCSEASVTVFPVALSFRRATAGRAAMHSATGFTGDRWRLAGVPRLVRARQRGAWRKRDGSPVFRCTGLSSVFVIIPPPPQSDGKSESAGVLALGQLVQHIGGLVHPAALAARPRPLDWGRRR